MKRTIAAFLLAPLIPATVFMAGAGAAVAVGYSYAASYILGIPVFLILRKTEKESHLIYGVPGGFIGALYVLVPVAFDFRFLDSNALTASLIFAAVGASVALCFSTIRDSERRKPI